MTDILDEARAALEGTTPGPWELAPTDQGDPRYVQIYSTAEIDEYEADVLSADDSDVLVAEPDATFIAAARSLVPRLCDEVERLRGQRDAAAEADYHQLDLVTAILKRYAEEDGCTVAEWKLRATRTTIQKRREMEEAGSSARRSFTKDDPAVQNLAGLCRHAPNPQGKPCCVAWQIVHDYFPRDAALAAEQEAEK